MTATVAVVVTLSLTGFGQGRVDAAWGDTSHRRFAASVDATAVERRREEGGIDSDASAAREARGRGWNIWSRRASPVPRVKLSYRRFSFVRIGATNPGSPVGAAAPQTFESLALDLYPISSVVRGGLTTQFGWESGAFDRSGDYFLAQSFSVGLQRTGYVTPFVEVLGGAGYMRRRQFETSVPTAYWQLGVDAGAEIYVRGRAYVSLAVGYLHPVNGFLRQVDFTSVYADTWSMKLGVGL